MQKFQFAVRRLAWICLVAVLSQLLLPGVQASPPAGDEYLAALDDWKAGRVAELKSATGYLNLAGLFWLTQARASFGSAADNDFVFPDSAAPLIGFFELRDEHVVLVVEPDATVLHAGEPVTAIAMLDDTNDSPVTVTHGSLAWTVIRRDNKFAVRLRDFEHPAIERFRTIDYYPAKSAMKVTARLRAYDVPRQVRVDTVIEGLDYKPTSPGVLQFALGGEPFELEPYLAGSKLLLVFGDQTSGRETYPAGRFLYADLPDADGRTTLDFNKAENPPCAFNEFATCPVASPRNRLKTRVEAGERFDPSMHHDK